MSDSTKRVLIFFLFLFLNFLALGIGALFTGEGVPSEWYANLSRAPWEPPGWVFGAAWTTIMLLFFSLYEHGLGHATEQAFLVLVYSVQWLLNILWNPLFFHFHWMGIALVEISLLVFCVSYLAFISWSEMKWRTLLLSPYIIWLLIATSLNAYAFIYN